LEAVKEAEPMSKPLTLALAMIVAGACCQLAQARQPQTFAGRVAQNRAYYYPWHGQYYHTAWGSPVALVVPPTAESQTNWHWGVSGTRTSTIRHQFRRPYPGTYDGFGTGFYPTPHWPSDTDQFGVYYIRGPW
jgi:hypothetical protein